MSVYCKCGMEVHEDDGRPCAKCCDAVDRLLHDAQHADSASEFAFSIGHVQKSHDFREKAYRLRTEARAIDPKKLAPAWEYDQ